VVISQELSRSQELVNAIVPEDYWKIVAFLFRLVDKPRFIVDGHIDTISENHRRVFIRLNREDKTIKIWQATVDVDANSAKLKSMSFKVGAEIEKNL
jgi:hypothetical protein